MPTLYQEILVIAQEYMGPAGEDYIRRRIRIVQAGRPPETLEHSKLGRLAAGIDMTARLYMSEARAARFRDAVVALERERLRGAG